MKIKLLPKCLSSTSTLSQSPAVFPQRFPQRSVCHMTICCALLRSLVHFDVDKRGRRAYNTWDEGRKKTQANSNQKGPNPTLNSACSQRTTHVQGPKEIGQPRVSCGRSPTPINRDGREGSKSESQQPYKKGGPLTTTRWTHNSARTASPGVRALYSFFHTARTPI